MPSNLREGDVVASVCSDLPFIDIFWHVLIVWAVQWQVDIVVAYHCRVRRVPERVDCGDVCWFKRPDGSMVKAKWHILERCTTRRLCRMSIMYGI